MIHEYDDYSSSCEGDDTDSTDSDEIIFNKLLLTKIVMVSYFKRTPKHEPPSMILCVWVPPITARGPPCPITLSSVTIGFSVKGSGLNGFSVMVRGSLMTGLMSVGPLSD